MMARKATNLLGSVSLIGGTLRRATDKLMHPESDDQTKFAAWVLGDSKNSSYSFATFIR